MNYVERKEEELKKKVIEQTMKDDFESFWREEVKKLRMIPLEIVRKKVYFPYEKTFVTYEITYNTHDNTRVNAYFSVPVNSNGQKMPCVACFHGGRGNKEIYPDIVSTGVCCFAIDVRSQEGTTIDKGNYEIGDFNGSLLSRGVLDKNSFYMKNIYLDAIRAIDVIKELPEVDSEKIVTFGQSQGGALSIVSAALSGGVKKCYAAVPSYNCLWERVELGSGVFEATKAFLTKFPQYTDVVFENLTYFDVNNMVSLLNVPVSICLGLKDPICLPEFVYSVYEHIPSEKEIHIVPFTPHVIPKVYKYFAYDEFSKL